MYSILEAILLLSALIWSGYVLFFGTWKETPKMCKCGKNPKCKCR